MNIFNKVLETILNSEIKLDFMKKNARLNLQKAFDLIDTEHKGYITYSDLARFMSKHQKESSDI